MQAFVAVVVGFCSTEPLRYCHIVLLGAYNLHPNNRKIALLLGVHFLQLDHQNHSADGVAWIALDLWAHIMHVLTLVDQSWSLRFFLYLPPVVHPKVLTISRRHLEEIVGQALT